MLSVLTVGHRILSGRWLTGQSAFSLPWIAACLVCFALPDTVNSMTAFGALIIVAAHFCLSVGSGFGYVAWRHEEQNREARIWRDALQGDPYVIARFAFWSCIIPGVVGATLLMLSNGSIDALWMGSLALV